MKSISPLFLFALLPACGATRNHVVGSYPDGSVAQEIDCRQDHPEKCQQRSQQLCQPFSRQPQIVRPMAFDQSRERWTMVITCGPPNSGPTASVGPPPPGSWPPPTAGSPPATGSPPPPAMGPQPSTIGPPPPPPVAGSAPAAGAPR